MTRCPVFLLGLLLISSSSSAQAPPPPPASVPGFPQLPPRDTAPKTGTARIRGRVVAADTGQPLRKAQVRATSAELRENRLATTDDNGAYEISELPAGPLSVDGDEGQLRPTAIRTDASRSKPASRSRSATGRRSTKSISVCRAARSSRAASSTKSASRPPTSRCRRCGISSFKADGSWSRRAASRRPTTSASIGSSDCRRGSTTCRRPSEPSICSTSRRAIARGTRPRTIRGPQRSRKRSGSPSSWDKPGPASTWC